MTANMTTKIFLLLGIFVFANTINSGFLSIVSPQEMMENLAAAIRPEALLVEVVSMIRSKMKVPQPHFNLPAMDPLQVDHVDADLDIDEIIELTGTMDQVVVRGLSKVTINNIKLKQNLYEVEFNLTFPEIDADGKYDVYGIVGAVFPLFGNGSFNVIVFGLTVHGKVVLAQYTKTVEIKDLEMDFNIGTVKAHFEDILGGGNLGSLVDTIISEDAVRLLAVIKPKILDEITRSILLLINSKLSRVPLTLTDVLSLARTNIQARHSGVDLLESLASSAGVDLSLGAIRGGQNLFNNLAASTGLNLSRIGDQQ